MIRRLVLAGSVSLAGLAGFAMSAPAAHAQGQVCYNIQANVAGNQVADQAGCQALP